MKPLSFIIAGSGWRAMFYVRIALRYPQYFKLCYLLCRTQEKAERIHREYGIPVTTDVQACEDACPDFVVVAVDRASKFSVTKQWLEKGYAVLSETPAALTVAGLEELWALSQAGARLQIAEQYIRYPLIAAGLRAVERGLLGDPYAAELSLAHDYHAASLIRHMLQCGLDAAPFPAMKLYGKAYDFPVEETGSRYGRITDGSVKQRTRVRLTIEFDNGKAAFYDFDSVQYHSEIRSRHINVQGQRGEWNDTVLRYVDNSHRPVREELRAWLDPSYELLQTQQLLELSRTWSPEVHMEILQDEYAIATLMLDMRAFLDHNTEGYPLSEALEDAYTWLLMDEAVKHPGQVITSQPLVWHRMQSTAGPKSAAARSDPQAGSRDAAP